jgi:hypothetical protein
LLGEPLPATTRDPQVHKLHAGANLAVEALDALALGGWDAERSGAKRWAAAPLEVGPLAVEALDALALGGWDAERSSA